MNRSLVTAAFACAIALGPTAALAQTPPGGAPDFRSTVQHAKDKVFPAVVYIKVLIESTSCVF